jgi:hypothetical protein
MSTLYKSGLKVKHVNIIHKWLKGYQCKNYALVVKRLKMSTLHKVAKMSICYTSS